MKSTITNKNTFYAAANTSAAKPKGSGENLGSGLFIDNRAQADRQQIAQKKINQGSRHASLSAGSTVIQRMLSAKLKAEFLALRDQIVAQIKSGEFMDAQYTLTWPAKWKKFKGLNLDVGMIGLDSADIATHNPAKDGFLFSPQSGEVHVVMYLIDDSFEETEASTRNPEHRAFWINATMCQLEEFMHWYQHETGEYHSENTNAFKADESSAGVSELEAGGGFDEVDIMAFYMDQGFDVEGLGLANRYSDRKQFLKFLKSRTSEKSSTSSSSSSDEKSAVGSSASSSSSIDDASQDSLEALLSKLEASASTKSNSKSSNSSSSSSEE